MSNIFQKITDLFKPRTDEIQQPVSQVTGAVVRTASPWTPPAQAPTVGATTKSSTPISTAFAPRKIETTAKNDTPVIYKGVNKTPFTPNAKKTVGNKKEKTERNPYADLLDGKSSAFYTPTEDGLASRAMQLDKDNGKFWYDADENTQNYVKAYYKTLDDPKYSKLYKDVESYYHDGDKEGFTSSYGKGHNYITEQLEELAKTKGKYSSEYRALERFMQDYETLGRDLSVDFVERQSRSASRNLDDTIKAVYSGVIDRDDFWDVAKQGEKEAEGKLFGGGKFKRWTENATELQKAILYYTYAKDGKDAAEKLYQSFLGDTLQYKRAATDYARDLMTNDKGGRFWEMNKANLLGAMTQTFGGMQQSFTNTKADPEDRNLLEGYSISDSIDDFLKRSLGSVDESYLEQGGAVFDSLGEYLSGEEWYDQAKKDATEYQKKVLGYLAMAYQSPEAAKETWDFIKERDEEIWKTVKGSGTLADKRGNIEGQMYREYLGLNNEKVLGSDKSAAQIVWDTALTTRAQYPQILTDLGLAALGAPGLGRVLGSAIMGTSVYGNEYKAALDEGYSEKQAIEYAASQAAMEFGVNMLLDGIAPYAGALTRGAGTKILSSIANPFLETMALLGVRGLGEGAEEYIQEIVDPLLRNWIFHEENEFQPFSEDAFYSFFLGAMSAMLMSPGNIYGDIKTENWNSKVGKALSNMGATDKLIDTILNKPVKTGSKEQLELYEEAKKTAQMVKDGKVKLNNRLEGKLLNDYAKAGGDVSFTSSPDTVAYTKEQITLNDMTAGAKSVLTELGADVEMANDIAKLAMGQQISEEAQAKINSDPKAQQVLAELQGELDMDSNNALARAARATTIDGALNKVYTILQQNNPDKHVVSPSVSYLINEGGMNVNDAEKIGSVINKVLDGIEITEDEAKLLKTSNPAIRGAMLTQADVELSEYDNVASVMQKANEAARARQKIMDQQAGVKQSVATALRVKPTARTGGIAKNGESGLAGSAQESGGGTGEGVPGGTGAVDQGVQGIGGPSVYRHQRGLDQGAGTGTAQEADGQKGRVIPSNELDEKQRTIHRKLVALGAQLVEFLVGEDSYSGWDSDRGMYVVGIRSDGQFSQDQYADHEPVHLWVRNALNPEYRRRLLYTWRDEFGADFQKAYDGLHDLYESKGYLDGLSEDEITLTLIEETLAMARGAQKFSFFDFAQYKQLADEFVEAFNLEAIGSGDFSNPEVLAAYKDGRINKTYYERQGFSPEEAGLEVGAPKTERPAEAQKIIDHFEAEQLKRSMKNLTIERKRIIREAEQNGTRNTAEHRAVIDALNEQVEEYKRRIAELSRSADEEEINGAKEDNEGRVRSADAEGEGEVSEAVRARDSYKEPKKDIRRKTAHQRRESRETHEAEVELIKEDGHDIMEYEDVPEDIRRLGDSFLEVAPDSDVTYYWAEDEGNEDDFEAGAYAYTLPAVEKGADGGLFLNVAKLSDLSEMEEDGYTPDKIVKHEKGHFWLDKAGVSGDRAWSKLKTAFLNDPVNYAKLLDVYKRYEQLCSDAIHDTPEELVCDIFGGRSLAFDTLYPELWPKVKQVVDRFFIQNTEYRLQTEDHKSYSADEDILNPESENYLGPEISAAVAEAAQLDDVYRNQDMFLESNSEASEDADAIGEELSLSKEENLQAKYDALIDELNAHPEREEEIWLKISELQNEYFNKTKYADEQKDKPNTIKKRTPTEMAFQPKKNEAKVEERAEETKEKPKVKPPTSTSFKPKAETKAEPKSAPESTVEEKAEETKAEIKEEVSAMKEGVGAMQQASKSLREALEENPELATDPDFLAAMAELGKKVEKTEAAADAFKPAEAVETTEEVVEEASEEGKPTRLKTGVKFTKKTGEWWKRIGKADTIQIRRRRSDRNTFDVRFTDRNGNTITYKDVSPAMLTSAFADRLKSRELAKQRVAEITDLAANPSTEWSTYENAKPEDKAKKVTVKKKDVQRDLDNYGRKIPVRLAQRMEKSTVRDENGALINTYRLAPANGVHNARLPGRVSYYVERPATMNTMRGLSGVEAYGHPGKTAYDRLKGWLDQLADPNTSKSEASKIRSQIAKEERKMREYTSGVTRLDPWRPGFEFATPQNIVNGKSMLEVYLDIRKPKVIDAKGKGEDFIRQTVEEYIQNPDNRAGLFDANNDPIGPYDGFKFTNAKIIPEGATLGGGNLDTDTVYVTLRNNQAKSTYNTAPTDSDFVQYSADEDVAKYGDTTHAIVSRIGGDNTRPRDIMLEIKTRDRYGYPISQQQAEYFKDAKVYRNGKIVGGIIPLFHGGNNFGHLTFDKNRAHGSKGYFFSNDPRVGYGYANGEKHILDLVRREELHQKMADKLGIPRSQLKSIGDLRWAIDNSHSDAERRAALKRLADQYNAVREDVNPGGSEIEVVQDNRRADYQNLFLQYRDAAKKMKDAAHKATNGLLDMNAWSNIRALEFALGNIASSLENAWLVMSKGGNLDNRTVNKMKDQIKAIEEKANSLGSKYQNLAKNAMTIAGGLATMVDKYENVNWYADFVDKNGKQMEYTDIVDYIPVSATSTYYLNATNPFFVDGSNPDGSMGFWAHLDLSDNPDVVEWALNSGLDPSDLQTDDLVDYAQDRSYDSLIIHNIDDTMNMAGIASDIYVAFESNQVKSVNNRTPTEDERFIRSADEDFDTGYTEGSLEDSILKIMRDKDEDRALAALTEYLAQFLQTGVLPTIEDAKTQNIFQPRVTPAQRQIIEDRLADLSKKYGTIEEGENPSRKIAFPKKIDDDSYVRSAYRTAAESQHTPDRAVPAIERELVQNEGATYQRITDKAATAYADREMRKKGYDRVRAEWEGKLDVEAGKLTKNDVALGELLYMEAVKVGDMDTAMKTLAELAEVGTTAGQVVQAFRMLKNMPKSYQLYYFQRVLNRLNRQFSKRIESGKMAELKIDKQYAKAVLNAQTQEELDAAIDELIEHVANQIPATLADKWNAWRYFAMLGNPKTHIRNVLGNAIFTPAKFMKDLIAAGLETTFIKDVNERQTSIKGLLDRAGTADYRKLAEEDFEGIKNELQSGGKYNPTNRILEARTMFKFKPLENLRRLSGDLLEAEDGMFLHRHYVNAMTNFLATRGVSIEELTNNKSKIGARTMNAARQYAFSEAQKATYRDASQVATALSQLKKIPVLGTLVEGMLPFTKTPINILKRGIEYSPVGLLKTIALETGKLKSGDISANEYIDNLSAGLTGTGIVMLGVFLSSLGILRGGEDDDEKQADFDKLQGYQNYSINVAGHNYTIDWMAPASLPLFVGSALYDEMSSKNGLSVADITNILSAVAEPITQLSMLSGVNDALKTAKWDENPISSVAMAMASGYASQGIPTLLAQISRSFTPDRKTTYIDKNSDVPQAMQRWWQTNVMGKTPLNVNRADYLDAWGRKDTTQSFALRLFENMLSPGYLNKIETTPVDKELQRLAKETGTAVLMTPADRSIEYNHETHNLTAEQYATYAKVRGDSTYVMLTELFNSAAYQHDMDDEAKAKAVGYIKTYGNSLGKAAVFSDYENDDDNWARKCDGDQNRLINMALLKATASEQGITASNNGEFYNLIIHSDWLGPVEQGYAIAQQYSTTSEKAYVKKGGPTYALTKERKEQMYEYYRSIFPEYYLEFTNTDKWKSATNERKIELLADLRKDVGTVAKVWLAERLAELGTPSDY